jgi:hypothetical protein
MKAKFRFGQLLITVEAQAVLSRKDIVHSLLRHLSGDWGECNEASFRENEFCMTNGGTLISHYTTNCRKELHIMTKANRSATIILIPTKKRYCEIVGKELRPFLRQLISGR